MMSHRPKRILLVEDDSNIAQLITLILESQGYIVESVTDGLSGVDCAKTTIPDLIIMDVMMPRMNGFEACRLIKDDLATRHIPLIMLSASHEVIDRDLGLAAGANRYCEKPFKPLQLVAVIKEALGTPLKGISFS
jgi:CheY-like chemotaxis protein